MPYRVAAPPEPDPPDPEEAYVAELRAGERKSRALAGASAIAAVALGAAAFAIPHGDATATVRLERLASERRAATATADARARAEGEQSRFEHALREAIGEGVGPRPELGACPVALPHPSGALGRRTFPLLVLANTEIGTSMPSQAVADLLADVRRAEQHLAAGRNEEAALYARALASPERLGVEVVLVTTTSRPPRVLAANEYEPGSVRGRAYLYRFADRRVICAAEVEAHSSRSIGYSYAPGLDALPSQTRDARMGAYLDEDMRRQLEIAIADAMVQRAR